MCGLGQLTEQKALTQGRAVYGVFSLANVGGGVDLLSLTLRHISTCPRLLTKDMQLKETLYSGGDFLFQNRPKCGKWVPSGLPPRQHVVAYRSLPASLINGTEQDGAPPNARHGRSCAFNGNAASDRCRVLLCHTETASLRNPSSATTPSNGLLASASNKATVAQVLSNLWTGCSPREVS